ncbi:MAG TPA: hypothetical protein VGM26_06865 [Rhizomicrobium sp.]|jgi:hypothetical protein
MMVHPVFSVFQLFLFFPEPKRDECEETPLRQKLLSASERLRVPTPSERLLQDQFRGTSNMPIP